VAKHIFQACPVWIYTQSNITSMIVNMIKNVARKCFLKRQSKIKISYLGIKTVNRYNLCCIILCAFMSSLSNLAKRGRFSAFSDVFQLFSILNTACILSSNSRAIHATRVKIPSVSIELYRNTVFLSFWPISDRVFKRLFYNKYYYNVTEYITPMTSFCDRQFKISIILNAF
jgi:hypothetical protein